MGSNVIVTIIVIVYLLFMLWIGWYSSTKISTNTDFMVAGRRLGALLMAGTLAATEIGGGSSLGVVQNGMSGFGLSASWYITTMGIAFIILSFVAPKFRAATVKTVPEYFRRRYGKSCGIITAVIMLLPLVGLTAGQFIASAVILSTMLNIDYINGSAALHKFQALLKQLPGAPHMGWKEFLNGHIAVVDCIEQRIQPGLSASHMDGHIAAAPGEHTGPSGLGCQ